MIGEPPPWSSDIGQLQAALKDVRERLLKKAEMTELDDLRECVATLTDTASHINKAMDHLVLRIERLEDHHGYDHMDQ